MLVLSRRPEEKILLPTVPVLIKVISSNTGLVRLGFEAPGNVPILREELTHTERSRPHASSYETEDSEPTDHPLSQRLSNLTLATTLLRMQLADCDPLVRKTLDRLEEELRSLRRPVHGSRRETVLGV